MIVVSRLTSGSHCSVVYCLGALEILVGEVEERWFMDHCLSLLLSFGLSRSLVHPFSPVRRSHFSNLSFGVLGSHLEMPKMSDDGIPDSSFKMSPIDEPFATCPISMVWVGLKEDIQGRLTTCLRSVKHSSSSEPKDSLQKGEPFSRPGRDDPIMRPPIFAGTAAVRKVSSEFSSPAQRWRSVETQTITSNLRVASRELLKALRMRSSSSVRLGRCLAMTMMESERDSMEDVKWSASQSVRNCLVR